MLLGDQFAAPVRGNSKLARRVHPEPGSVAQLCAVNVSALWSVGLLDRSADSWPDHRRFAEARAEEMGVTFDHKWVLAAMRSAPEAVNLRVYAK